MADSFLFRNGSILTMDPRRPWAQAMVVRGRTIAYVGPAEGAAEHVDASTELVDLRGQLRMEDRVGSLTVAKAADVTVLGADLFRTEPHEIHAVPVVFTMMDGRVTHDARD